MIIGQLITVTDNAGHTVESYVYDGAGNILSATKDGTTHSYSYGDSNWKDLLTSYDGQSITYDAIGNPTGYLGNTLTWQNGRELASYSNSTYSISYSYDVNGLRTEKAVTQNGVTTNYQYFYNGSTLLQERIGSDTVLNFIYTADGKPYALEYSTDAGSSYTTYYYLTNLQGDVVSILDSNGAAVVSYSYDSWGRITQTAGTLAATLGIDNPLRYRGYVFDEETSLYYLQSRYYDPQICRFINADNYASTGTSMLGTNVFIYCENSQINNIDETGEAPWHIIYPFWGLIHYFVQLHIIDTYGSGRLTMENEIKLPSGRYGRGDICNVKTGEVWEIKYAGLAAAAAPAQLALYATGTYKSSGVHVIIGSEMFVGYFVVDNIEITYWTEPGGIILYDFNILNEWKPVTIREKARTRSISKEAIATTAMGGSIALACCIGSQLNGVGLVADSLQFERYLQ